MAENKGLFSKFAQKMKTNKKLEIAVYSIIVIAAVAIYFSGQTSKTTSSDTNQAQTVSTVTEDIWDITKTEEKLANALSQIKGAGKVSVMITYESGSEIVPAMSVDSETSSSDNSGTQSQSESLTPVTIKEDGDDVPLVLTEKEPVIKGVLVIAEGAHDTYVKLDLQRAVQAILGVSASAVEVFEMEKSN
jgi:stage III sporulation protein AG